MNTSKRSKADALEDGEYKKSKSKTERSSTLVVNTTIEDKRSGKNKSTPKNFGWSLSLLTSKPVIAIICGYALLASGAWAYLLNRSVKIPGLESQISKLKGEVDRLENEVSNLKGEVDRLEKLNKQLKFQVDRLDGLNEDLKENVDELGNNIDTLRDENNKLNATAVALEAHVEDLNKAVTNATIQNIKLNETVTSLDNSIGKLQETNQNLTESVNNLTVQNTQLTKNVQNLTAENQRLETSIDNLGGQVTNFTNQVQHLQRLNDDLVTIVSFVNETGNDSSRTLSQVSGELARQITENRRILLQTKENTYKQLISNFECRFDSRFSSSAFVRNKEIPIGPSEYPDVISWTNETYLSEVCANMTDFELFLATNQEIGYGDNPPPVNIKSNQLIVGHYLYNTALLNHYFPDAGEPGLTINDWTAANYSCDNLPSNKKFIYI